MPTPEIVCVLGMHRSGTSLITALLLISLVHRNPMAFDACGRLLYAVDLYLACSACGAALSLDRRIRVARLRFSDSTCIRTPSSSRLGALASPWPARSGFFTRSY